MKPNDETPVRPAAKCRRAWTLFLALAVCVLTVDLVSKTWSFATVAGEPIDMDRVRTHGANAVPFHEGVTVVPGVLDLRLTVNRGAVFGIGQGQRWLFAVVSVAATGIIVQVFRRTPAKARAYQAALGLILAGALGNLYDRLRYAGVRDMLHLFPEVKLPLGWRWPGGNPYLYPWIFNVADVALVVGVAALLLHMFFRRGDEGGE